MTALAVNGLPELVVSDLEIGLTEPCYTFDTLARLQKTGLSAAQIFFITGADAFAEIDTWSRYPQVLEMAHFVVVSRPGFPVASLGSPAGAGGTDARGFCPGQPGLTLSDRASRRTRIVLVDAANTRRLFH